MTRSVLAAALLLGAAGARAAGDHEMLAAQQELKLAKDHLQAATPDYQGHRHAAIQHIDKALQEIHQGIELSRSHGESPAAPHERKERRPAEPPAGGAEQPNGDD